MALQGILSGEEVMRAVSHLAPLIARLPILPVDISLDFNGKVVARGVRNEGDVTDYSLCRYDGPMHIRRMSDDSKGEYAVFSGGGSETIDHFGLMIYGVKKWELVTEETIPNRGVSNRPFVRGSFIVRGPFKEIRFYAPRTKEKEE